MLVVLNIDKKNYQQVKMRYFQYAMVVVLFTLVHGDEKTFTPCGDGTPLKPRCARIYPKCDYSSHQVTQAIYNGCYHCVYIDTCHFARHEQVQEITSSQIHHGSQRSYVSDVGHAEFILESNVNSGEYNGKNEVHGNNSEALEALVLILVVVGLMLGAFWRIRANNGYHTITADLDIDENENINPFCRNLPADDEVDVNLKSPKFRTNFIV